MESLAANLSKQSSLAQSSLKLMDALAGEGDLNRLVEIGYEMLGNSILIINMSFKRIAYLNHSKINDDPVWNEFATAGYASFGLINHYTANKLMQIVNQSQSSFIWSDPYSKYPRIMSKVAINSKQIAVLSIIAHEKPFQEIDLELADLLSKAISIALQKNKFIHYSRELMHEEFIIDLLYGKKKDRKTIEERIKALNIKFKKNLYTLTLDISSFDKSKTTLLYLKDKLEQSISNSKTVVYDDNIVLIVSCDNSRQFFKSEMQKLKAFLKNHQLYAGISRCYYGLEEVQEHYLQALNALRLGMSLNKEEYFFSYEEYALYHFVESCSNIENLKKACHPSLLKLIEYDRENKTNYTRSLYAFILHSQRITESAKDLNIHRNTMFYRLEKIQDIIDIDINNQNTSLHLHLSFKILELLKIDLP
ncbi:PucR family transcriptional regulator [Geosporobacter ferrireducens]|uniref:PucR C-terminal helix-turn-helix domain-containing protein n=1 Tax=Geosporobacter ferrireducens TaxID=1424294 RepID=A0A1D8GJZ8_9FIRM|nr:helix-turn-helix domain-containing protein [Geosporobacter ferrireducens]AOT71229.1 hypothetical protein Gferi_17725 [Geosporobacter ferrireducens]MTI58048.1 PucR family transcriptional regulator [Geosporobacter ferrireducens]